ncbi:MAG TPA: thioredoxin domain-containing protein [Myxococcaceae bacterium]|nr:thioredoxin domain-containing protein [Myxococcaceae bacterium]
MKPIPPRLLPVALATALFALAACSKEKAPAAASASGGALAPDKVVATYSGGTITAGELELEARPKMQELQNQMYQERKQILERMAIERIIKAEAAKKNMTEEQYMQARVEALPVTPPSDAEAKEFFDRLKAAGRLPPDSKFETMKDQLVQALVNQQRRAGVQRIVDELRTAANLQINLPPPRVEVAATGPARGPANAKVTIVEFSDFQCPYCGAAFSTVEQLMQQYAGKVKLVFRQFPLPMHPQAAKAAEASLCAADQGKFWEYHDLLFRNQKKLEVPDLKAHAASAGLDTARFSQCLDSGEKKKQVDQDLEAGQAAGVNGTPAFFINGVFLNGAVPIEEFKKVVDPELASR